MRRPQTSTLCCGVVSNVDLVSLGSQLPPEEDDADAQTAAYSSRSRDDAKFLIGATWTSRTFCVTIIVQHVSKCISRPACTPFLPARIAPDKTLVVQVGPTATLLDMWNVFLAKTEGSVSFVVVGAVVCLFRDCRSRLCPASREADDRFWGGDDGSGPFSCARHEIAPSLLPLILNT